MCLLEITNKNGHSRSTRLENGTHLLGSDISSDIVLLDKDINPKHLHIFVSDEKIEYEFIKKSGDSKIVKNDRINVKFGDILEFEGFAIKFISSILIKKPGKIFKYYNNFIYYNLRGLKSLPISVVLGSMFAIAGIATIFSIPDQIAKPRKSTHKKEVVDLAEKCRMNPKHIELYDRRPSTRRQFASLHLSLGDIADQSIIFCEEKKEPTVKDLVIVQPLSELDQVHKITRNITESLNEKVGVKSFDNNQLTLTGVLPSKYNLESISKNIKSENEFVKNINFNINNIENIENLRSNIKAVWAGNNPYILDNNNIKIYKNQIFLGQYIVELIKLGRIVLSYRNQKVEILL